MRIAYVISYLQPQIGYMEYYLPKAFTELGHKVCVFTSDRYYPVKDYNNTWAKTLGKRIIGKGLRIERGIKVNRLTCLFEYHSFCILYGLIRALYEFQPDIVQFNGLFTSLSGWYLTRAKRKLGYGLVCDEHAADFNTNLGNHLLKRLYFYRIFFPYILPKIIKEIDTIVAIGENEQRFTSRNTGLSPSQIPIIKLGADTDVFRFNPNGRIQIRKELGLEENDCIIFFCGKINPGKRIPILLEAVSRLSCEFPELKLLIVGKGSNEYQKYLFNFICVKGIENRVRWVDFVANPILPHYMSAADVGCWPGDVSIGVLESMSVGLPVILSSDGEGSDAGVLLSYNNGMSVRQDDVDDLIEALRILIEKPEGRTEKGKMYRRLIEERLSWKVIANQYLELYDSILSKRRSWMH